MAWSASIKNYFRREKARISSIQQRNTTIFKKQPWTEISGSFGDLGTFIPIFIALVGDRHSQDGLISSASTLVFSGLFNVLTGLYFGIPLPVQPMKAIAAVAIAKPEDYNQARYASAGLFVAAVVGLLSLTGLVQWFTRKIPVPIVKGIQVGAGFSLIISAITKLHILDWASSSDDYVFRSMAKSIDNILLVVGLLLLLSFSSTRANLPFVLVIVTFVALAGIIVCIVDVPGHSSIPSPSIWRPEVFVPGATDFAYGAFNAGLGQLPLTTLNSIVAVVFLAEDFFPEASAPSATAVGTSVAVMNLIGCWFKAMPVCHGSGGLAAQYRFGARSGASIIFLGALKIVLGLFFSEIVVLWCRSFPPSLLAILLFLAGVELVKMGQNLNGEGARDLWKANEQEPTSSYFDKPDHTESMRRYLTMMVTVGTILGTKNDGAGFIVGLIVHYAYRFQDWLEERRSRQGRIRLESDTPSDRLTLGPEHNLVRGRRVI